MDTISRLPDALISEILLYLPTKEAVRTSVLSNRWNKVWLSIPGLDLDANEFPNYTSFVIFVERFLDFSREYKSCLQKLKLSVRKDVNVGSCVTRWVDFVATPKLKHLDVACGIWKPKYMEVIPLSLYICDTLVYLRLHRVSLPSFKSVSLPCLKTMHLERNIYSNEACFELLISSCQVLEDLRIVRGIYDNVEVLRVRSHTLTNLSVGFGAIDLVLYTSYKRNQEGLLIDAPRLKYLYFKYERSKSITMSNLGSLAKLNIQGVFTNQRALDFLTCISRVKDMTISDLTMSIFCSSMKSEPLLQFCNLSKLELAHCLCELNKLPTFLKSCPNLKSIVLDLTHLDEKMNDVMDVVRFWSVPLSLLSSLEFVEIKSRAKGGRSVEIEVARYFVQNSALLKKLVFHLNGTKKETVGDLTDLLALPRLSPMCQILCQ